MALWGNVDQSNNAPAFVTSSETGESGIDQYGNTVFGVDVTEAGVKGGVAPGWTKINVGRGALTDIVITAGGTSYANADTISITSIAPGVNAAATIVTDGSGVITAVTITEYGTGFDGSESVTITTSTGSTASLTPAYGGRSGRVTYESLVAMSSITGDGSDDAMFPDS